MKILKFRSLLILFLITPIHPNGGSLDISFGISGVVLTEFGSGDDIIKALVIQTDNKIVAAGSAVIGGNTICAIARYNTDGSLDSSFGTGGKVTTSIPGTTTSVINSLAIQSDNKIVAAGTGDGVNNFQILRYNTNGTLDTSFGTNGIVTYTPGGSCTCRSVAIQSDGKIIAGGQFGGLTLIRVDTSGTLDNSFGAAGVKTIGTNSAANALVIQPDGKILAAGQQSLPSNASIVVRLSGTDGSEDNTFGSSGIVTFSIGSTDGLDGITLQSDGKIVVCGFSSTGSDTFPLVSRLNTDGSFDTSFAGNGKFLIEAVTSSGLSAIGLQSDNKIMVAGETSSSFLVIRINTDGTLDSTYGTNGIVTTQMQNSTSDANALAIQSNNTATVGGFSGASQKAFTLARYLSQSQTTVITYSDTQGGSLVVPAPGLLNGQQTGASVVLLSPPTYGIITISADGSFVYVPNLDFSGTDSFIYTISINGALSSYVTVVNIAVAPNTNIPTFGLGSELVKAIQKKYGTKT